MADDTTMMTHSAPVQEPTATAVPAVAQELNGKFFMENPKGGLDPLETVRPADLLQDETVRRIMGFATSLSAEVARFKQHTLNDFAALLALAAVVIGPLLPAPKLHDEEEYRIDEHPRRVHQ